VSYNNVRIFSIDKTAGQNSVEEQCSAIAAAITSGYETKAVMPFDTGSIIFLMKEIDG
jgi:hypothetical protein